MPNFLLPDHVARRLLTRLIEEQAALTRQTEEVQGLIGYLRVLEEAPGPQVPPQEAGDALAPDAPQP